MMDTCNGQGYRDSPASGDTQKDQGGPCLRNSVPTTDGSSSWPSNKNRPVKTAMTIATSSIAEKPILLRHENDGIATLTLNRPRQYNCLSQALLTDLQNALNTLGGEPGIRVIVIAGNGAAFCAGHDLKEMHAHTDQAFHKAVFEQCSRLMLAIRHLRQPVIAKVHGIATAAGCQLVASCDLAVASSSARFATSGINVGLFCSTPAVAISRNMPGKHAMKMLLTGDFIDAPTAVQQGLINEIAEPDDLDNGVRRLAESICEKSPAAIATGKEMYYRQLEMGVEQAYEFASETMVCSMNSEDAREGVDAFIGKRKPRWTGH